jgi:hypothetical protein
LRVDGDAPQLTSDPRSRAVQDLCRAGYAAATALLTRSWMPTLFEEGWDRCVRESGPYSTGGASAALVKVTARHLEKLFSACASVLTVSRRAVFKTTGGF